jgi:hypothetical protein
MSEHHIDFGKRRPLPPPGAPPVKRSGHIALLLMGTLAVGGSAYALMPRQQNCAQQASEETTSPAQSQTTGDCGSQRSSSHSGRSSHWGFFSSNSDNSSSAGHASEASSSHVARGGFGSAAHAFGFSRGG